MSQQIDTDTARFELFLQLGDNALILGHRLSEWSGDAPVLEEDVALTNIALDLIGQARFWLTAAGKTEGLGRSEDDLAYHRDARDWRNLHLVELTNGDFARTVLRQYFTCCFWRAWRRARTASSRESQPRQSRRFATIFATVGAG